MHPMSRADANSWPCMHGAARSSPRKATRRGLFRKRLRVSGWLLILALALNFGCRRSPTTNGDAKQSQGPVLFEEITAAAGIQFIHDSSAQGEYFLPEQVGSGTALFDFDNDGRLDIYLVQCGGPGSTSSNRLFHQETDGRFRDVSAGSGLDVVGYGMGVAAGDINNDGLTDLVVTEYGSTRLFENLGGGKFHEITKAAGIDNPHWATAAAFFDYDRDGRLDLVVGNYLDYNPEHKCYDAARAREYCGPQNFPGLAARLFRNRGGSGSKGAIRFEDVTLRAGLAKTPGPALGVLCADFNGDRLPDIFFADDGRPNRLFIQKPDGTFEDEAALRGVALNGMGETVANMGVAFGDVNGDGFFDLFVTHLSREQHALWVQGPRGLFRDETASCGLANPGWRGTAFGDALIDLDHDGSLDLALVNGLIARGNETAPRVDGLAPFWRPYAQRYQLFLNSGNGAFVDVSEDNPAFSGRAAVGRGLAFGDIDNDGDLDLLTTSAGGPAQLFRNVALKHGHWLMIRAIDPAWGGRDALGAEVVVEAGGKRWWRLVQPSCGFLVANDPRVHVGLGSAASVDSIDVTWPDSSAERFSGGPADRQMVLRKGSGAKR